MAARAELKVLRATRLRKDHGGWMDGSIPAAFRDIINTNLQTTVDCGLQCVNAYTSLLPQPRFKFTQHSRK